MDVYEFVLFLWMSTLTAFNLGIALAKLGDTPKGQGFKTKKAECIFNGTCACPGDTCFSNFATDKNNGII